MELKPKLERLGTSIKTTAVGLAAHATAGTLAVADWLASPWRRVGILVALALVALVLNPPVKAIPPGEVALRTSRLTGDMRLFHEGGALVVPFIHELRPFSLRDQVYRPRRSLSARGEAPFQSAEGLPVGLEVTARWALDPDRILTSARRLPLDVGADLVGPTVDAVLHRGVAKATVREIFASKRLELQDAAEKEVRERLAPEGVLLKTLALGSVDLPPEYKQGLEKMLADELANDRMHLTLELKEKQVRETELEAAAEAARKLKEAEARGQEQVIAAKAQAEAMKHVLPFKQKEIEQRRMEAEARAVQRTTEAKASADSRRIEAAAEAESRLRLAQADVEGRRKQAELDVETGRKQAEVAAFRAESLGKVRTDELAREAEVITRNPLLVQKAFAEKLSEHLQVVVAQPGETPFLRDLMGGARGKPVAVSP